MQSLSLFCTNFGSPKESNYVNCSSYCLRPSVGQSVSQLVESLRMLNVSQRFRPCFAAPHYPIMSAALFHCWSVSQTEYLMYTGANCTNFGSPTESNYVRCSSYRSSVAKTPFCTAAEAERSTK